MKRPLEVALISIAALIVCALASYYLRPWLVSAIPIAVAGAATIATLKGVGAARIGVTAVLASAGILYAIEIFLIARYLEEQGIDWPVWSLSKRVLISMLCIAAAAYLFSPRPNRYFRETSKQPISRSTKRWSACAGAAMLFLSAFFYDLFPRLMGWPLTVDDAVEKVILSLSEEDQATIAADVDGNSFDYHFSIGLYIRNQYGLWAGNHRLCRSATGNPFCHPDEASAVIINRLRENLRAQK